MQRHERLLPESSNTSQKHFVSAILVDGDKHHVSGKLNELNEAEYRVREDSVDRHNLGVRYTHWAETDKNRPRIAILTLKTRHWSKVSIDTPLVSIDTFWRKLWRLQQNPVTTDTHLVSINTLLVRICTFWSSEIGWGKGVQAKGLVS